MIPAVTIGIPASAGEQDLAGTLASLRSSAERAALRYEMIVAVNGPGAPAPAEAGVVAFSRAIAMPVGYEDPAARSQPGECPPAKEAGVAHGGGLLALRLLRLPAQSKVAAWNALRAAARAPIIVFADADVRVAPGALGALVRRLDASPTLAIVAGREVARLEPGDGLVARAAALPYRFDFGNVPGRLYALRVAAMPEAMPPVVAEDGYLTVRFGRRRFVKDPQAVVYLRPPTTWRDYLRQRVRHELGKLQLQRDFEELYRRHGFGHSPRREFLRAIALREYPLVALSLGARWCARLLAWREMRSGVPTGWAVLPSTKLWSPEGPVTAEGAKAEGPYAARGPGAGS